MDLPQVKTVGESGAAGSYAVTGTRIKMKIKLKILTILITMACSVRSGSVISLKFVQDFMSLYRLKDPMFVLQSSDLDDFFWQLKLMSFETIYCLCYGEGMCN